MENGPYHVFLSPRRCVILFYFQFQYIPFSIKCKATIKFYHSTLIPNKQYRNSSAQCNSYNKHNSQFLTLALCYFIPRISHSKKIWK